MGGRLLFILIAAWAIVAAAIGFTGARDGGLASQPLANAAAAALVLIALAAIIVQMARWRRVNIALRVIVALVALYAAVPVGLSLFQGTGLSGALATSLFTGLPYYLRGAYLAVEGLIPLAALASIVIALGAFASRDAGRGARAVATAVALAIVAQYGAYEAGVQSLPTIVAFEHPQAGSPGTSTTVASAGTTAGTAAGASDNGPSGPPTQPCFTPDAGPGKTASSAVSSASSMFSTSATPAVTAPDAACQGVRNYIAHAQAVLAHLPQRDIDLIPLAQSVPSDPAGIDTFVRDAIALNMYSGLQRGPLGTWLARAGNPTDKLSLLAQLLKMHGVSYTIVRGTLSDQEIAKVTAAANAAPAPLPQATDDPALLAAAGMTQDAANDARSKASTAAQTYVNQTVSDVDARADALVGQLKSANVSTIASDPSASWPQALRTHYWLRLSNGTDLDPTTADLAPGSHLGTTSAETQNAPLTPEMAQITVRIVATSGGSDTTVLESKHAAYEYADTAGMLALAPAGDVSSDPSTTITSVTPTFTLGSDAVKGTPIAVSPSLGGVRLEIERDMPGAKPEIFIRKFAGGEADASTTGTHLLRAYHIVVATQPINRTYATQRLLNGLIGARAYLAWAADPASNLRGQDFTQHAPSDYPIDIVNYLQRIVATDGGIGAANRVQFAYDRPQIVMEVNEFERVGGKNVPNVRFDIVDNGAAAVGADRAAAFRANVARGIADTLMEGQVINATDRDDTPTLLRGAATQNVPTVVLDGVQKKRPDITLSPAIAYNLDQTFLHGAVAVAPQQMIAMGNAGQDYGWWAIDASGNTVGRMGSGAGQDLPEWAAITNWVLNGYNVGWALLMCHGGGSKAECQGAWCSAVFGAVLGLLTSAAGGYAVGRGIITAGTSDVVGLGLGGLPAAGWSPASAACGAAGIGPSS